MATETPGMVCGPTTGCGQTTPMVPTRIHTANGIEKGWQAPAACRRCGKPFGFFSLINNPPPIAPLSPWFVFASSLGEPVSQEAPDDWEESYTMLRDALEEHLGAFISDGEEAEEYLYVQGIERIANHLAHVTAKAFGGGIPRTENEPPSACECLDATHPEFCHSGPAHRGWCDMYAMATDPARASVISSASPLSEEEAQEMVQRFLRAVRAADRHVAAENSELAAAAYLEIASARSAIIARLSASAPSPEDKGSRC